MSARHASSPRHRTARLGALESWLRERLPGARRAWARSHTADARRAVSRRAFQSHLPRSFRRRRPRVAAAAASGQCRRPRTTWRASSAGCRRCIPSIRWRRAPICCATIRRSSARCSTSWNAARGSSSGATSRRPLTGIPDVRRRDQRRGRSMRSPICIASTSHAHGLTHLGKPTGFVGRQVRGWSERWQRSKTERAARDGRAVRVARRALAARSRAPGDRARRLQARQPDARRRSIRRVSSRCSTGR